MFLFSRIVQRGTPVVVSGLRPWPGTASEAQLASDHVWSPRSSLLAVHPAHDNWEIMMYKGGRSWRSWRSSKKSWRAWLDFWGDGFIMGTSETMVRPILSFFWGDMSYKRTYCSHITSYNLLVIERFHQGNSRGGWSILQWLLMIFQVGTFHQ